MLLIPSTQIHQYLRPWCQVELILLEFVGELSHRGLPSAARHSVTFPSDLLRKLVIILDMPIEVIKSWALANLLSKDVSLEPPREHGSYLIFHMCPGWDTEDIVELL